LSTIRVGEGEEMDEKKTIEVEELAKIIHKHYQHIQADWEEYTKSDLALAYAIKWNGYRKERDTARDIGRTLKSVIWEEEENETIRIKDLHKVIDDILNCHYGVEVTK
jgi:hypothetical protein